MAYIRMAEYNYNAAAKGWKANVAAGKINVTPQVVRGETPNQKRARARQELMNNFAKATANWKRSPNVPNTPNSLSTISGSNSPRSVVSNVSLPAPVKKWAKVKTLYNKSRKGRKTRKNRR